jgi:hypothetical protein
VVSTAKEFHHFRSCSHCLQKSFSSMSLKSACAIESKLTIQVEIVSVLCIIWGSREAPW